MALALARFEDRLARLEEVVIFLLTLGILVTLTLQVVARHLIPFPPAFTEELVRILLVWLCFVGAAHASFKGQHFVVPVLMDKLRFPGKDLVSALVDLATLGFIVLFAVIAVQMAYGALGHMFAALQIPFAVPYAAVPVGFGLMAFHIVMGWVRARAGLPSGAAGEDEGGPRV